MESIRGRNGTASKATACTDQSWESFDCPRDCAHDNRDKRNGPPSDYLLREPCQGRSGFEECEDSQNKKTTCLPDRKFSKMTASGTATLYITIPSSTLPPTVTQTITVPPSATASVAATMAAQHSHQNSKAVGIGAGVGAGVGIPLAIIIAVLLWRRRKSQQPDEGPEQPKFQVTSGVPEKMGVAANDGSGDSKGEMESPSELDGQLEPVISELHGSRQQTHELA
ncbi:hypothetical protein FQN51_001763 [Onygenales sp. PD_10]|nr:hypothetical protein FQN51_001763 [Onygenales sp. PD_10]